MAISDLADWLTLWDNPQTAWLLKRLSANDTLANGAHQVGPYMPKDLLFGLIPNLDRPSVLNPDVYLQTFIDSHKDSLRIRAVWYNNRLHGRTRNETRLTGWGGVESPLLDPESTGALVLFAFVRPANDSALALRIWVCKSVAEEELVEERFGQVESGEPLVLQPGVARLASAERRARGCRLTRAELPPEWLERFPPGSELVMKVCELKPLKGRAADERLVLRRQCEYELFQSVEEATEAGVIRDGFASITDFLQHAHRILQRRKARSGRSLELQTRQILIEEGLVEHVTFEHGAESEPGHRPDFLFPSATAYADPAFPVGQLRMLAAKTTCRDRWRQVLNEAKRIRVRHLLTLQEGVSVAQFAEMREAGVRLVVPQRLLDSYPDAVRPELLTLARFIAEVRALRVPG